MLRFAMRASIVTMTALTVTILLSCSSEQNPFYDPANVTMSFAVAQPDGSSHRVGDTVCCHIDVHLPYLVATLTIDPGDNSDSSYAIPMPTDESVVDYIDSAFHVYREPGSYQVEAVAERTDGELVTAADSVTILGLPPAVEARADTVRVAEGASCTLGVSITGTAPFAVEWHRGDTTLPDTAAALVVSSADPAHEGAYRCVVTSDWGSDTSAVIQLVVMEQGWVAPPTGVRVLTQSPALYIVWEQVPTARSYRVYHSETAYDESGGYDEVTTTYYESSNPAIDHYYWIRAVDSALVSEPSDTVFVTLGSSLPDNVAPFWHHQPITRDVHEGDTARVDLHAECLDPDENDTVTYTLTGDDRRAWLTDSLLQFAAGPRQAGVCTLTVVASDGVDTSHAAVIVTITERTATLVVHAENGEVTRDPQLDHYRWGDTVSLAATPSENYEFAGWSGDTTAGAGALRLVLTRDTTEIVAQFQWAGDCVPVEPGQSLNAAIRENSPSSARPAVLCPKEGYYDQQTIRIYDNVRILID